MASDRGLPSSGRSVESGFLVGAGRNDECKRAPRDGGDVLEDPEGNGAGFCWARCGGEDGAKSDGSVLKIETEIGPEQACCIGIALAGRGPVEVVRCVC